MTDAELEQLLFADHPRDQPFDLRPVSWATLDDIDRDLFENTYLPATVSADVLAASERDYTQKLSSLRLIGPGPDGIPTVTGLLAVGRDPLRFLNGAYIQFLRLDGLELTDAIQDHRSISGPIPRVVDQLDELFRANNAVATNFTSAPKEVDEPEYPLVALQQIARNAVMHRVYEGTNTPIRITWFRDRIEILSPGGPFGGVNVDNFGHPGITDYRNPHIAEAMSNLGYVQRFGVGIALARREMKNNGNPPIEFNVNRQYVLAILRRRGK